MSWAVTVERDGEKVVTIETNCLSGRDLLPGDEDAIREAAHHLLSFIGDTAPPKSIPFHDLEYVDPRLYNQFI